MCQGLIERGVSPNDVADVVQSTIFHSTNVRIDEMGMEFINATVKSLALGSSQFDAQEPMAAI